MTPEAAAAVLITVALCAVAAYVALARQGLRHAAERTSLLYRLGRTAQDNASLQRRLWRAEAARERAEELMRRLCGTYPDPEETDLLSEELDAFDAIAGELGSREEP